MFYRWFSIVNFDNWHASACTALGIPHPNHNQATGEIDPDAQWTTAYTDATVVAVDDVRAYVEQSVAELVPDGLGTPSEPPPAPDLP
jgi:hypothetical protein